MEQMEFLIENSPVTLKTCLSFKQAIKVQWGNNKKFNGVIKVQWGNNKIMYEIFLGIKYITMDKKIHHIR